MNHAAGAYQRAVCKRIRCRRKVRKEARAHLQTAMALFLDEHPEATAADLYDAFGTPDELAATMQAELPPEEVTVWKREQRIWKIIVCVFVLLVIWIVFHIGYFQLHPIYTKDEVIIYAEQEVPDVSSAEEFEALSSTESGQF